MLLIFRCFSFSYEAGATTERVHNESREHCVSREMYLFLLLFDLILIRKTLVRMNFFTTFVFFVLSCNFISVGKLVKGGCRSALDNVAMNRLMKISFT